ncbi:DUF1810 family protein [Legionella hackeliae]|uniref:DUF1810 domain-containing protein n=1 Tax=Legionella hackeliae TaxID=449 RepID=A0A0A8UQQ0_LEGHA|nr:DUF1810 family protein [Legionella hackeliae]KTD15465.1 hypothetical protein Lhac_0307 [Legionella hackeliae]CEK11165.1 protein of unknown function [Legionella hackeliae]STX47929.1 Uncharacterized conserved protein [Legionella hackeliae]
MSKKKFETSTIDLSRFLDAQKLNYERAHKEISSGKKATHWIWYIFPQLQSLGYSPSSKKYGILNLEEACAYLKNPILFDHYHDMVKLVAEKLSKNIDITTLMGWEADATKLASSLTLFHAAAEHLLMLTDDPSLKLVNFENDCRQTLENIAKQGYIACEHTLQEIQDNQSELFEEIGDTELSTRVENSDAHSPPPAPTILTTAKTTETIPVEMVTTPSNPAIKSIVDTLINNIQKKKNERASWFNMNSDTKVEKLTAISQWLSKFQPNEGQQEAIIALIRDTCSIKRNFFGLFEPHSVQELRGLLKKANLDIPSSNISFTPAELSRIKKMDDVNKALQEKTAPGSTRQHKQFL